MFKKVSLALAVLILLFVPALVQVITDNYRRNQTIQFAGQTYQKYVPEGTMGPLIPGQSYLSN